MMCEIKMQEKALSNVCTEISVADTRFSKGHGAPPPPPPRTKSVPITPTYNKWYGATTRNHIIPFKNNATSEKSGMPYGAPYPKSALILTLQF